MKAKTVYNLGSKIIKFCDNKIRMKLVWLSLVMSLLLILWKGVDYRLAIIVSVSCAV